MIKWIDKNWCLFTGLITIFLFAVYSCTPATALEKKTVVEKYGCHPVLEYLAKDNGMNCEQLLVHTGILRDFEEAYAILEPQLPEGQEERVYRDLLNQVVDEIVEQILKPRKGV